MAPPPGDDLPIFDEAPLRDVEFAPRALRPPGGRGRLVAGAWAIAVGSLIGVGLLAGEPDVDEGQARRADAMLSAPDEDPWPPDARLPSTRMGALLLERVIELASPAPARVEVTTPRVEVAGTVLVRAARVRISLEARGNRVLEHVAVDVGDPDGGIRPVRSPTFAAAFDLPFPRPNGTMWVVVTAYDEGGMPLGSTRRPFEVGPLLEPPIPRADSNPMGERWRPRLPAPALAAPPPGCLPMSPILASSC